jgi:hypothetical protein
VARIAAGVAAGKAKLAHSHLGAKPMLSGDFAIGLMTIITGLAIADLVISTHGLLMNRRRVRWDWLALLAAFLIFLLIVSSWGISYKTMGNQMINPPLWLFVIGLSQIIPLYLAARAALPDSVDDKGVDLAAHYAGIRRYFWGSVAFTYAMFVAYGAVILGPGRTPWILPFPLRAIVDDDRFDRRRRSPHPRCARANHLPPLLL